MTPDPTVTPTDGPRLFVISGCSSAGKSTLLDALAARGERVVPEPGRRIVRAELERGGDGLPWANAERFMSLCAATAIADFDRSARDGRRTFFDRGFVDVASAVVLTGFASPPGLEEALRIRRYAPVVFMAPPWGEIYRTDPERRHGLEEALAEYEVLVPTYRSHGYEPVRLPKAPVAERVEFVLETLTERGLAG
jgi:predicted ATPase